MISNQILQNTLDGIKSITQAEITAFDRSGNIVATTKKGPTQDSENLLPAPLQNLSNAPEKTTVLDGVAYFNITSNFVVEYILAVSGEDACKTGKLAALHIESLLAAYKELPGRDNFLKNLLMDNLLLVDIYSRAKQLNIENQVRRVVYLVETAMDSDMGAVDILRGIFPDKERDFITAVDETSIILVKEISADDTSHEIERMALTIADTLSAEAMAGVSIAIGSPVTDLKNISSSFKEARLAQDVRKIFEMEKQVVNYECLGIGRLIYQLPSPLCRIFVNEMLQGFSMSDIDEELFVTVQKFFENDLNVSKTAQDLFIHRNTLVYRLDKIQKLTRLDLRKFTDAITFKITLMVTRYMQYREKQQI